MLVTTRQVNRTLDYFTVVRDPEDNAIKLWYMCAT